MWKKDVSSIGKRALSSDDKLDIDSKVFIVNTKKKKEKRLSILSC